MIEEQLIEEIANLRLALWMALDFSYDHTRHHEHIGHFWTRMQNQEVAELAIEMLKDNHPDVFES